MSRNDRILTITGIAAAVALIAWIWWQHAKASNAAAQVSAPAPASAIDPYAGATGMPITPQIQYGQPGAFQGTFNLALGTITLPGYHYSGNHQIYMPLFGFVGYSNYASG